MGIEHKHAYRFGYLKSEDWKVVRKATLWRDHNQCKICHYESESNDAHHIHYPDNIWETMPNHLITLCRRCHDLIHELSQKITHRKGKTIGNHYALFRRLSKMLRDDLDLNPQKRVEEKTPKLGRCTACRHETENLLGLPINRCSLLIAQHACKWLACHQCRIAWSLFCIENGPIKDWPLVRQFLRSRKGEKKLTPPQARCITAIVSVVDEKLMHTENSANESVVLTITGQSEIGGSVAAH